MPSAALRRFVGLVIAMACAQAALAHDAVITITGHYDNAVGTSDAASQGVVGAALVAARPVQRPGDLLESVPGVVATQHSGDGKANQFFLRGFNLDHGTDFAVRVNGVPVNMPSHAHGQGYADLNFLIPELVRRIDYRKGPVHAMDGDFSLAGAADIAYRRTLEQRFVLGSIGQGGHARMVVGAGGDLGAGRHWMGALELTRQDGPWTVPEDLRKHSAVFSLGGGDDTQAWSLNLMSYRARWTATDQVPERALRNRTLGRYDSLDASSGGQTERHSLGLEWRAQRESGQTHLNAWVLAYGLDLYSNFTYALQRPATGDQFHQADRRHAAGLELRHAWDHALGGRAARSQLGLQWRGDSVRLGLFDTEQRALVGTVREDNVNLRHLGLWGQTDVELSAYLRALLGVRADQIQHDVQAVSEPVNSGQRQAAQVSPRLSLVAGPFFAPRAKTEVFLNLGRGFHSHDARGSTTRVDPRSGEPVTPVRPLGGATGWELGLRSEPAKGMQTSVSLWGLRAASELVYLGDAGATAVASASHRRGIELSQRLLPHPQWTLDADLALSRARLDGGAFVPNAVQRMAALGIAWRPLAGMQWSLQGRHIGAAPLTEDGSARSRATTLFALRGSHAFSARLQATLDIFNLLDRQVDDIQYQYASRLPTEPQAVDDRHVHPAEPRRLRLSLRYTF